MRRYLHAGVWKPAAAGGYTLTDLNPRGDVWIEYVESAAYGINNRNVIAGAGAGVTGLPDAGFFTAAGVFRSLGDPSNGAFALHVADSGHYCGYFTDWSSDFAFYSSGAGTTTLPDLGGGSARAMSLNAKDLVVGWAMDLDCGQEGCIWIQKRPYDIHTLIPGAAGCWIWTLNDINDDGYIVGQGMAPDGKVHAILLSPLQTVTLSVAPTSVFGGAQIGVGTVALGLPAPAGGETVTLGSTNPAAAPENLTVVVPEGATKATFNVLTGIVGATTKGNITAGVGSSSAITVFTVKPLLASLKLSATTVKAGQATSGTVSISAPAPAGGITVALGSANPALASPTTSTVSYRPERPVRHSRLILRQRP